MTKPTLLPGGCSQKRGVDFQVFHSHFRGVAFLIIALLGVISSQAADVRLYTVTKGTRHFQTNDLGPRFLPVDEFIFEARVLSTASNLITSARVQSLTDGPVQILTKQDPMEWEYDADANNLHDLNVAFPDGNYRYNILTTNDDRSIVTLSLSGSFPSSPHTNAPHILNYNELQSASGTGFVQVIWAPFTNGTRSDSIQLRVEDRQGNRVFETRDFDEPGALDGTATSAIIEPGNLQPGKTYDAWLEFRNTTDLNTTAYPGAIGWAYKHRRTEFTIKTPTNSSILDLESYVVCKGHSYIQTNLNGPFLEGLSNNAFVFSASLESTQPNLIISNLFIAPNDQTFIASREDCRPDEQFEYSAVTSSQTGLDNQFPNGDYQIRVRTTNQGLRSMSLTLAGTNYPPAPWILNFDPSIPVRTTNAIEIRWKQWVGGTANDFIQLRLLNGCSNVFETGDFGDNDALNGYATNTIIPADVMKPSITYRATLVFRRYSDLDFASNPGAAGIACLFSRTRFDVTALLDVQAIDLAKGSNYVQTNFVSVVPDGTNANEFFAVVDAQFPDSVTAATVDLPDTTVLPLLAALGDDEFVHSQLSSNSLDTTYPPGRYVFKVWTTNDGFHTVPLSLSPLSYPPPPRFLHDPTNRVPHDQTNQIVWSAWTGGTTNDFIQLRIRNAGTNVWETPDFGEGGALNGTATTAYIPANALTRGENYNAQLIFRRTTDTNTTAYPGSLALAYYFSQTEMDLRTIAPDI